MQAKFAARGRKLQRVRRLADVGVSYVVDHRGDARHFQTWPDVLAHLTKIGAAQ